MVHVEQVDIEELSLLMINGYIHVKPFGLPFFSTSGKDFVYRRTVHG